MTKPPKIEKIPIRLVTAAESRTMINMAAKAFRGSWPRLFLTCASAHFETSGRTTTSITAT